MGTVLAQAKRAIAGPRKLRQPSIRKSSTIVPMGSIDPFTGRRVKLDRHSSRADARRDRERRNRHLVTRKAEHEEYALQEREARAERRAAQGPRHFYGAWTPYGVSAWAGGHAGRAVKRAKHHARRAHRAATVSVPRVVRKVAHRDVAAELAEYQARLDRNLRAVGLPGLH